MSLTGPALGAFYALLTAFTWAVAVIYYKRSGESVAPFALNFFKIVVSLLLLGATMFALGQPLFIDIAASHVLMLFASGLLGIAAADTLFFASLNLLGAGRSAVVDCLYAPFIVVFAFVLQGERLDAGDAFGGALIVLAVLLAGRSRSHETQTLDLRHKALGIAYGAAAMALMGIGIVAVKPIIEVQPVLWTTTVRLVGGLAGLSLWLVFDRRRRDMALRALRPGRDWRFSVPATVLGSYVAPLFWLAGFKYTSASIASMLNQTSTVLIVVLAAVFLRERVDAWRASAVACALAGSALVLA